MNPWAVEIIRFATFGVIGLLVGAIVGKFALCLGVSLILFTAWHAYQLYRLLQWIQSGNWLEPNNVDGAWGELYGYYYRLKKRNKKRRKRLLNIIQQLQESSSAMPYGTVELAERGEILRWNDAAYHLLGLRKQKDVGVRIDNLVRTPAFTEYLQKGDYKDSVTLSSPIDDAIILSVQIAPYAKRKRLMVIRDITHLHRLEMMRQDFVANVSHEMKTPVTVMRGFIDTMLDADDEFIAKWSRSLTLMKDQTLRMQNVVEDLLFLSRLETKAMYMGGNVVDIPMLLDVIRLEALVLLEHEHADKQLSLGMDVDQSLKLIGEETELRSAFINLVTNAIYYSRPQGEVVISWKRVGDEAVFSVKDSGIGISLEDLPRITERFYRAEKSRSRQSGGTGLGLSIVKHVLTRHQADLRVTSTLNVGSTFSCVFPESRIAVVEDDNAVSKQT